MTKQETVLAISQIDGLINRIGCKTIPHTIKTMPRAILCFGTLALKQIKEKGNEYYFASIEQLLSFPLVRIFFYNL